MDSADFDGPRFCPHCGVHLQAASPAPTCPSCGYVRRRYPVVGVAVVLQDARRRVLMGRRSQGHYAGLWCIPCGKLEWGEDVRAGAAREALEETGLEVEVGGVVAVHSNFHRTDDLSVGIWFRGEVTGGHLHPADGELTELAYFDPADPPELAFPTDALVLEQLAMARAQ